MKAINNVFGIALVIIILILFFLVFLESRGILSLSLIVN